MPYDTFMTLSPIRRRLLYRAMHRGFKEADLVIGNFAKRHLEDMTSAEVDEFSSLLEVPDQELYAWIIGREDVPDNYNGPVFRKMRDFEVATLLLSGSA
ncbi:succinate dehydrogenase assembly factor 2 [Parvularcula marina]|nr:succinate dehydrogenase assembly factor 2 [Parvularcula marina]